MKLLTFSTLFPNAARPQHGIFVETRLRHLVASGHVQTRVLAPVPWFPFRHRAFGRYATYAQVPLHEWRSGLSIGHPRYPVVPKVGMVPAPFLLAKAVTPAVQSIINQGYDFDLIDAHYFYPDGVAAVLLAQHFKKPVVVTARGSDINLIPRYRIPRKLILWAAGQAEGIITVCQALKQELVALGADGHRIVPLRNGIDLDAFKPCDRASARQQLGLTQFTLISVGHLIPEKGHDLVIAALPALPDVQLLIVGGGPERTRLEALAHKLHLSERVTFLGVLPQRELARCYGAADALVLASCREGWANVLLESMACGSPVLASNVNGTPEVVASPEAGVLLQHRTAAGIVDAVRRLRACYPNRLATRRYAEQFSWADTTAGQLGLFRHILSHGRFTAAGASL